MPESTHGFTIDEERCNGRLACMRACPTQAIRVRNGKAKLLPRLCIDCGSCLRVCPSGAIQATTRPFAEIDRFKYKVAVPSPVLFGQFPTAVTPPQVVAALLGLGFDAVWDFEVELALVNRAILDYVNKWEGPHPLLSVSCPVIVRLVQVLYPGMIDQLVRIQPPRELAARELKRKYSQELGIDRDDIAAIYITPCQAKTISILKPAEGAKSHLDGALGISDVYNDILALIHRPEGGPPATSSFNPVHSTEMLRWSTNEGQGRVLRRHRYMSVTGLSNVIHVFDDIEKGKLRNIDFLECHACWGGCINGNLTVDNVYVTLGKMHRLASKLRDRDPEVDRQVERRYPNADFSLQGKLRPRATEESVGDLNERVGRIKVEETVIRALPGLNCGLCGAPNCKTLAKDVALGNAAQSDCVFFSDERLKQLRRVYWGRRGPPAGGAT